MLKRINRLRGRITSDFFRNAKRMSFDWTLGYFLTNVLDKTVQIAIIAPKKQLATSVARHQAKRKMAAALDEIMMNLRPGQYVFVLNRSWLKADKEAFQNQLKSRLSKLPVDL